MTTETEIREAIAAAASSVDGVKCSPWFRQTTKPGSAHVTYGRSFRDESGFGFMNVWQVLVVLPQDIAAAEKWIAAKGDALLEALGEPLVVTGRLVSVDGRKIRTVGSITTADGQLCVSVEGLFIDKTVPRPR